MSSTLQNNTEQCSVEDIDYGYLLRQQIHRVKGGNTLSSNLNQNCKNTANFVKIDH